MLKDQHGSKSLCALPMLSWFGLYNASTIDGDYEIRLSKLYLHEQAALLREGHRRVQYNLNICPFFLDFSSFSFLLSFTEFYEVRDYHALSIWIMCRYFGCFRFRGYCLCGSLLGAVFIVVTIQETVMNGFLSFPSSNLRLRLES